ncbi:MAG: hypothetical protein A2010_13840 [Nitrospirae bacterium GWD2_57_9]|nr:MAG: hypothetical protein A2010_13840 [Nitrospirae bacterium GWD2_57_9]OGW46457.1 MAG: hypothetical protein A2078_02815 [Nitrospirae bacterium GWC2_57_9]
MSSFLQMIFEPLKEVYLKFINFLPNLLAMLIVILIGVIAARIVKALLVHGLRAVKFDSWSDRMGLTSAMRKGDLWSKPTEVLGAAVFWVLIIVAFMAGMSTLKLDAIDSLVARFVLYLPRAFSAVIILVFGYIIAGFVGRAVVIAAVNQGFHYARLLAEAVRLLMIVLVLAMALEQLQVAPEIVVAAFSILFGGIVLALAIAFGVGGIDAAKRIIAKESLDRKEKHQEEIDHI